MTRGYTLSDPLDTQLREIKRDNPSLSFSDIILVALKQLNHESLNRIMIINAVDELRAKLPNLIKYDYDLFQTLIIKLIQLEPNQLDLARKGLGKFISDLSKLPKDSD